LLVPVFGTCRRHTTSPPRQRPKQAKVHAATGLANSVHMVERKVKTFLLEF